MELDNQQPSLDFDKGWLAGIIDGEGCLQLAKQKYPHGHGFHYRPQIIIGNNNPYVIECIAEICKRYELPFYLIKRPSSFEGQAQRYVVQIMGLKRVKKWMDFILSSLVGKRPQAEVIKAFIEYRATHIEPVKRGVYSFGEKDEWFKLKMTEANRLYRSERLNDSTLDISN